ncbi:tau 95 subunit of transcription factor TFIIIC [Tulasnella sp. 403]|nr:tau 95 subunit of transcription factor TFIIIC [Tulasnella sp. 403]
MSDPKETLAQPRALPQTPFYTVEYPGYVSGAPESLATVLKTLGGQPALDKVFKQPRAKHLDLNLRPDDLYAHPIPGESSSTVKILVKVTTRRRRKKSSNPNTDQVVDAMSEPAGQHQAPEIDSNLLSSLPSSTDASSSETAPQSLNTWQEEGVFKVDTMGVILKTVRFRAMADFQYAPDPTDPVIQLRETMQKLDDTAVNTLLNFSFPPEKEDYSLPLPEPLSEEHVNDPDLPKTKSNVRLPPFPVFSRVTMPSQYNYKANPFSVVETIQDPVTGEEKERLINKTRFKGFGAIAIDFHDTGPVPSGITENMAAMLDSVSKDLYARSIKLFEERPVWSRAALLNQFPLAERREIFNSKAIIPLVSYAFHNGPFRDMYIRFGYDPRKDIETRFYQRVTFRYTTAQHARRRPIISTDGRGAAESSSLRQFLEVSNVFDGKTIGPEVAPGYQLCDITDPLLRRLIEDTTDLRTECHERDGWYSAAAFDRIKAIARRKLFSLIEDGRALSDSECADILEMKSKLTTTAGTTELRVVLPSKERKRKRNRAKGTEAAEEDAVARLELALRRQEAAGIGGEEEELEELQDVDDDSDINYEG